MEPIVAATLINAAANLAASYELKIGPVVLKTDLQGKTVETILDDIRGDVRLKNALEIVLKEHSRLLTLDRLPEPIPPKQFDPQ